jgi:hypothetical protein
MVTKSEIIQRVRRLQEDGYDIGLDWAYGQGKITTRDEGYNLLPRRRTGELSLFLDGVVAGIMLARRLSENGPVQSPYPLAGVPGRKEPEDV